MACTVNKSALCTVTTGDVSVAADGYIPFNTNTVLTGSNIQHVAGSTTVTLSGSGLYLVEVGADCLPSSQVLTTFQLMNNGNAVNGALAAFTGVASTTNSIAFSTLVRVLPSCCVVNNEANLQVMVDVASTVGNCYMTVVKLA